MQPAPLNADWLESELAHLGCDLQFFTEIGSTNEWARLNLPQQASQRQRPLLVIAEQQSQGKGRDGNNWLSTQGALTWSLCLPRRNREHTRAPAASLLPIAVGIRLCQLLQQYTSESIVLKWPNDICVAPAPAPDPAPVSSALVENPERPPALRKLGGILIEQPAAELIIGVGINANNPVHSASGSQEFRTPPTSLIELNAGQPVDRNGLCREAVAALIDLFQNPITPEETLLQFEQLDCLRGKALSLETPQGTRQGIADGIDTAGALRVISENQTHCVHSARHLELL